ncbi:MAG: vitamin B12-dependent ribonucleotide reductase [Eubacteriales bacterium]|nr:vitamin B12-dependent ribonucleotide reductase [Eubacteriales bacterium]MDD3072820.1 vitamin B12-dependent ribonucleotide reductase [Eubacteriales bacterium]MDD4078247.1 vitamin B12-dependent ribonucleotide reductase [Eubacteriales bacterium]MDD4768972.1 vitamin B12-dependent ribonucleotide reductase [Eubacteriales bacterium]
MTLTENARIVLEKRYLVKEDGKVVETPEDMFRRVAQNIALAEENYPNGDKEKWAETFYKLMTSLDFLPNSPTLMNAGRDLQQLAACFVLPVEDTMEDIFDSIKSAALIHKSGGGTGFSFSRLRPKNDLVMSTGGVASGPVSFMKVFNSATEAVKQGGTRRGANMGMLRVDHPDILSFITAKEDNSELTNFNISVALTEEFMDAVKTDREYSLINPRDGQPTSALQAKKVFDKLVDAAWRNGEPGIIFLDRVNKDNPTPQLGDMESTNPCGEQPLLPYEACNLGSINISRFVKDGAIDYRRLEQVVHKVVRFLDNVIDMSSYPLPKIQEMVFGNRKIGLGLMGFADALYKLSISYNSFQAVELGRELMEFIQRTSREASRQLAEERGAYPNFSGSRQEQLGMPPMRNATTTTIAPTGTISIIAGTSSGIEPNFALCYNRNVLDNDRLVEVHPLFEQAARDRGFYTEQLVDQVAQVGSVQEMPAVPEDIQRVFVTAHDITPEWHIQIQAAFQQYTDNAVSKTVNLSHDATREDVAKVFSLAYELGCKGVTVYRDGSRDSQVLSVGTGNVAQAAGGIVPRPRPEVTAGRTEKVKIGCGTLYISVNSDEQGICEVFTNTGREGGCASQSEATARLVSIALRSGISVDSIVEQLRGIRCPACIRRPGVNVTSCPDAIAKALKKSVANPPGISLQQFAKDAAGVVASRARYCPECGNEIQHEGGCTVCLNCGYSHCG